MFGSGVNEAGTKGGKGRRWPGLVGSLAGVKRSPQPALVSGRARSPRVGRGSAYRAKAAASTNQTLPCIRFLTAISTFTWRVAGS